MHDTLHRSLAAAHAILEKAGKDDDAQNIEALMTMFAPHDGDDPTVARGRLVQNVECGNCGQTWPAMAFPAPLSDTTASLRRLAKCPRCFATNSVHLARSGTRQS